MLSFVRNVCLLLWLCFVPFVLVAGCTGVATKARETKVQNEGPVYPAHHVEFDAGRDPENIVAADFNNDGILDVAISSHGDSCVKIFLGKGHRGFHLATVIPKAVVGFHPDCLAATDWDKDGYIDLVLAAEGRKKGGWLRNKGGNGFEKAGAVPVKYPPKGIALSDLDGDGNMDIVLGPYSRGNVMVLWGKAQPRFEFQASEIPAERFASSVSIADWNSDGRPDVFWTETEKYNVKVALNQGNRRFHTKILFHRSPMILELPRSVVTADVDGDGCVDALSPLEIGKAAIILHGDCKGNVKDLETIKAPVWGYRGIGAIAASPGHPAYIALGEKLRIFIGVRNKAGKWDLHEYKGGKVPEAFIFKDMDKDGNMDVLFVDSAGDTASLYYGPLT